MREAPVGFSWTVLFFGFFPALFRRDWLSAVIIFLVGAVTLGFSNLVFMFIYNKMHLKGLIKEGFEATSGIAELAWIEQRLGLQIPRAEASGQRSGTLAFS